jgi:hypothetical protein
LHEIRQKFKIAEKFSSASSKSGSLYTLSLNHGVFPELLKTVRAVPIFKWGDKTSCDNYRPISVSDRASGGQPACQGEWKKGE